MKKFFAAMLAVCIVVTSVFTAVYAADAEGVSDGSAEAVAILKALGIYDDEMQGDEYITRGDFAPIVYRLTTGGEYLPTEHDRVFADVAPADKNAFEIAALYDLGLVGGYADGTYCPNENLTNFQAIKIIMNTLGYAVRAQSDGGYMNGYIISAVKTGVADKIDSETDITVGELAVLIVNALDADVMSVSYTGSGAEYTVEHGKSLLSESLCVTKESGIVNANGDTELGSAASRLSSDEVRIGDDVMRTGNTDAAAFLGYKVTYYYKYNEKSHRNELLYISKDKQSSEVIVSADDINTAKSGRKSLVYESESGRERTESISSAAYVVYNGCALTSFSDDDIRISNGFVKIIKNSGERDVVLIEDMTAYIADSYMADDKKIYAKNGSTIKLNDESNTVVTDIIFGEESYAAEDISEWQVLSVMTSKDGIARRIYVSADSVEGTIDSIETDGTQRRIEIDGKIYELLGICTESFNVGDSGRFLLDCFGKIAARRDGEDANRDYALMTKAAKNSDVMSDFGKFRMYTADGKWQTFGAKKDIKYTDENGNESFDKSADVAALLDSMLSSSAEKILLVKYKADSEGKLTSLALSSDNLSYNGLDYSRDSFTRDFVVNDFKYQNNLFVTRDRAYTSGINTPVFVVPPRDGSDYDEKEFSTSVVKNYFTTSVNYNKAELYNLNADSEPAVVVLYESADTISVSPDSDIAVITGVGSGLDKDGNDVKVLKYMMNGKEIRAPLSSNVRVVRLYTNSSYLSVKADSLKFGDVVQLGMLNGEITTVRPLYINGSSVKGEIQNDGGGNIESRKIETYLGTVREKNSSFIMIDADVRNVVFNHRSARVYVCDGGLQKCYVGNISDVVTSAQSASNPSKIFARVYLKGLSDIIVYK